MQTHRVEIAACEKLKLAVVKAQEEKTRLFNELHVYNEQIEIVNLMRFERHMLNIKRRIPAQRVDNRIIAFCLARL